jgi:sterol desaturase/sphingolipid hydroxylase (fatty acid hydroxylase superfamily)
VLFCAALLPLYWAIALVDANVAALFCATLLGGYLSYEIFHACEHLPPQHRLAKLPWIRHMRRLHQLHHRRDLMQTRNFNLVFPLTDWVCGTLYWEAEDPPPR